MTGLRDGMSSQDCWDDSDSPADDAAVDYTPKVNGDSEAQLARLLRTIEGEVIPRLVLAHRTDAPAVPARSLEGFAIGADQVEAFTAIVLAQDVGVARSFIDEIGKQGAGLDEIFLDLLAPTARRLGEFWKQDRCTFMDVTIGLGRLQQLMRDLSRTFRVDGGSLKQGRRVLLVPTSGEQHNFGLLMVGEFMRRAGWDVTNEPAMLSHEVAAVVKSEWFTVIGFSLSCDQSLEVLSAEIVEVRQASRNDAIRVMVGGRVFVEHPEHIVTVGADAMALDGRQAVKEAEKLHSVLMASC